MYDENGFAEQGNSEIYTECKVVEPQDHKKKKSGKRIVKWTAGILCAAMLCGPGRLRQRPGKQGGPGWAGT